MASDGEIVYLSDLERRKIIFNTDFLPVYGERLSFFIAGPPGCGKSTTARDIMATKPHKNIFLFSDVDQDRAFEGLDIKRVKMNKDILSALTMDDLTKDGSCWVIFDDIDKIRNPSVSSLTIQLLDNIVANGRSHGGATIDVIVTSHSLSDYRRTKYSLENCNYWVIFPKSTIRSQVSLLLKKLGLEKIKRFYDTKRLIIHHSIPQFAITDDCINLLA